MKINVKIEDIPFGTSIQDIKVPDVLRKRVKTGLDYFDAVLGGEGFTPSMVTLFTGTPGAGKTTMMLTLVINYFSLVYRMFLGVIDFGILRLGFFVY